MFLVLLMRLANAVRRHLPPADFPSDETSRRPSPSDLPDDEVSRCSPPSDLPRDPNAKPWPWLRRFLKLWLYLLVYWAFTIGLDAYGMSPVTHRYAYGLVRFWFFYLPVFGFFVQIFYSTYDGLGVWTPGLSYTIGLRTWLRDLLGR